MKQLNAITSRTHLPHSKFDNQQTHFDSVRLLKGAAPGRKQVSFYSSELNCLKNSKMFAQRAQTDHLYDVLAGQNRILEGIQNTRRNEAILWSISGNYSWSIHHTGMGGPTADQKFYDPERVGLYNFYLVLWTPCISGEGLHWIYQIQGSWENSSSCGLNLIF